MTSMLRSHRISLGLASIVLAAGLGGSVGAQEQPPPEEVPSGIPVPADSELGVVHSWALAPAGAGEGSNTSDRAFLTYEAAPGTEITDAVTLFNLSNVPLEFDILTRDARNNPDGSFAPIERDQENVGVGAWITLPRDELVLPPGKSATFNIVLTIPKDARPGDHAGLVLASSPAQGTSPDGRVVTLDRQTGTRVYLRVEGPLDPELAVADLSTTYTPKLNPLDGTAEITYDIENRGNVRLSAENHEVSVAGPFGIMKATAVPTQVGTASADPGDIPELLPGESISYTARLDGVAATALAFTEVSFDPVVVAGDAGDLAPGGRSTLVFAIPLTIVALLVSAGLVGAAYRRFRRHRDDLIVVGIRDQRT